MKAGYSVVTTAAVALVGAAPKTILGVKSAADFGIDLKKYRVAFDGVTASAIPVLMELCYCTWATNGPGTNSTSRTPAQLYGRVIAHGVTAASAWTAEPTVLTVIEEHLITPAGGLEIYDFPLGDTPDSAVSEGFALRLTAPATVSARAGLVFERA